MTENPVRGRHWRLAASGGDRGRTPLAASRQCHRGAFTLVEILISILILSLGVLGLGALFPVIIREQRIGADTSTGVLVSNSARAVMTQTEWGQGLLSTTGTAHPAIDSNDSSASTQFLWDVLRDPSIFSTAGSIRPIQKGLGRGWMNTNPSNGNFQYYGQGEWFTGLVRLTTTPAGQAGTAMLGYPDVGTPAVPASGQVRYGTNFVNGWVDLPVARRLYPVTDGSQPQFVWDFALQRVSTFEHLHRPIEDPIRAVVIVRRIDPRIRATGTAASIMDALTNASGTVAPIDRRLPVGEDPITGDPTLDGTGQYSAIKTCDVAFYYDPNVPAMNHRDRLYIPIARVDANMPTAANLPRVWAQMRQPGQKLVDNLGNVYTVVGSGNEPGITTSETFDGVPGADYLQIDPAVPEYVTKERSAANPATQTEVTNYFDPTYATRAIRQVAYTPQIPVSVTLVELAKGRP